MLDQKHCNLPYAVLITHPPTLLSPTLYLSQPSVLIVSYIESVKAATRFGFYQQSEWKPDDSMIAVVVSKVKTFFLLLSNSCSLELYQGFLYRTLDVTPECRLYVFLHWRWSPRYVPLCQCLMILGGKLIKLFYLIYSKNIRILHSPKILNLVPDSCL